MSRTALPWSAGVAYIGDAVPLPEKALIGMIRRMAKISGRGLAGRSARATHTGATVGRTPIGIGDDCAVLRVGANAEFLVTTDFSLEGIHFRREWHPAESVGHRALARGLSDIAAMGGDPVAAFLSLALPRDLPQTWVKRFLRGLIQLGERYGIPLAGGDTAQSPGGIVADIVVVGAAPKGKAVLRSGAQAGDRIYVSGELGGSAAAILEMEMKGGKMKARPGRKVNARDYPRHFYPEPRVAVGRILREKGWATAMMDLSDGLSTDLAHICEESGVGAEIMAESVPLARVGKPACEVDLDLALHGGEDYELLFTAPRGKQIPNQIAGVAITSIGYIKRRKMIFLCSAHGGGYELEPRGWEHFRRK